MQGATAASAGECAPVERYALLSFPKVFFTAQRFKVTFEASGGFGCAKHRQAQTAACRER